MELKVLALTFLLLAVLASSDECGSKCQTKCHNRADFIVRKCWDKGFCDEDDESLELTKNRLLKCLGRMTYLEKRPYCAEYHSDILELTIGDIDIIVARDEEAVDTVTASVPVCTVKSTHLGEDVDGFWDEWDAWGDCDVTCGEGLHSRTREYVPPRNNGEDVEGYVEGEGDIEIGTCSDYSGCEDIMVCQGGQFVEGETCSDCPAGTFSPGENSVTCISCPENTYSSAGSSGCHSCPGDTLVNAGEGTQESDCEAPVSCDPGYINVSDECLLCPQGSYSDTYNAVECTACPEDAYTDGEGASSAGECKVDGAPGDWGEYTACSAKCNGGEKTRTRACDSPAPANGGNDCDAGDLTETESCNTDACQLILFNDDTFTGTSHTVSDSLSYTDGYNDKVTSVKAVKGNWKVHEHKGYTGKEQILCEGDEVNWVEFNDQISSVSLLDWEPAECDYEIWLYEDVSDTDAEALKLKHNDGLLKKSGWNDKISVVKAVKGFWRLYENDKYSGDKKAICEGTKYSHSDLKGFDLADKISSIRRLKCCPLDDDSCDEDWL